MSRTPLARKPGAPARADRRRLLRAVALPATVPAALALPAVAQAASATAEVRIDDTRPAHPVDPRFFGANLQWEHAGDGARLGDRWAEGLLDALRDARIASLRFPGGDLANTYRWKHGIGPQDRRIAGRGYGGDSQPSLFGTDEFLRLCRDAGQEPVFTVNANESPAESADWVEYVNGGAQTGWGARRHAHGLADTPKALWWEIGNETFNPKQPGFVSAEDYARRYLAHRQAMKARDPSIKAGLVLEGTFVQAAWMAGVYPHLPAWNEAVLRAVGRELDFVVLHFYAPHDKLWRDDELHRVVMAGPDVWARNLEIVRGLLARHARADTDILLSEYGLAFADRIRPSSRIASAESALFAASLLLRTLAVPAVRRAHAWSLLNNASYGALTGGAGQRLERRPLFEALRAAAGLAGGHWLPVTAVSPGFAVKAIGNVPALGNVATLDAGATRAADGAVRLLLVNRSPDTRLDINLRTQQSHAQAQARIWRGGAAAAERLEVGAAFEAPRDGNGWSLKLPPASFATVHWPASGGRA